MYERVYGMRYLLDTHVLIWFLEDDAILPNHIIEIIEDDTNFKFISIGSLWEIVIKMNLGKIRLKYDVYRLFDEIEKHEFELLQITKEHLDTYSRMHFFHGDPFDRLLISVAKSDGFQIITSDKFIHNHDVRCIW